MAKRMRCETMQGYNAMTQCLAMHSQSESKEHIPHITICVLKTPESQTVWSLKWKCETTSYL